MRRVDFTVEAHAPLVFMFPVSDAGRSWFREVTGGSGTAYIVVRLEQLYGVALTMAHDGLVVANTEAGLH